MATVTISWQCQNLTFSAVEEILEEISFFFFVSFVAFLQRFILFSEFLYRQVNRERIQNVKTVNAAKIAK